MTPAESIRRPDRGRSRCESQVRRQFKLGLLDEGSTVKPDYARCVEIVTRSSLRQMVAPVRPTARRTVHARLARFGCYSSLRQD